MGAALLNGQVPELVDDEQLEPEEGVQLDLPHVVGVGLGKRLPASSLCVAAFGPCGASFQLTKRTQIYLYGREKPKLNHPRAR